jgi:GNAT superfamily N-acetyltransferase
MEFETFVDDGPLGPAFDPAALFADTGNEMRTEDMTTRPLTKADYDHVVRVIDKWWGGPTSALAHPIFFYELGEGAMVVEANERLVGFLFGFIAPNRSVGYVHLVGIDPEFRRKHVGSLLYGAFEQACRNKSCSRMKAITTIGNEGSIRFHEALGWQADKVDDYAGPGRTRLVFSKQLNDR